jgi:hypothetical protein
VHPEQPQERDCKIMTDYVDAKAKELGCMIVLDALQEIILPIAYYNQGFIPKGFHFLKILDENGLS